MKRTTIVLEPELEIQLKLESMRLRKPMSEIIREALRRRLREQPPAPPPGAGAFSSGVSDTAERAEEALGELGFGEE